MAAGHLDGVLRHIRKLARVPERGSATDRQLLERFLYGREEAAFAAVVERHGPMVMGVCRRLLRNTHDAEDAFQATFLVLAGKAAALHWRESVGGWLYEVACRVARKARADNARRRFHERQVAPMPSSDPLVLAANHELQDVLEEELRRLPEKYRLPVVLCCLEGTTRPEAARQLGWKEGTVAGRLARGRSLLQKRLARRGVVVPASLLTALVAEKLAPAAVSAALVNATLKGVSLMAAGQVTAAGLITDSAHGLAKEVLHAMFLTKVQVATVLLALAVAVTGTGLVAYQALAGKQDDHKQTEAARPMVQGVDQLIPDEKRQVRNDSEPLPAGAVARMGTVRLRNANHASEILTFAQEGKTLISADIEGVVHVWDVKTGKELRRFKTYPDQVQDIRISRGHQFVAAVSFFGQEVGLWDFDSGKALWQIGNPVAGRGVRLAFSPDGKVLAMGGGKDVEVSFWDAGIGQFIRRLRPGGKPRDITRLAFSADGSTLLAKSSDGVVHFWDAITGKEARRFRSNENRSPSYALAPDGRTFAFGEDRTVVLWDLTTEQELARLPGAGDTLVGGVAFSPDGKTLASAGFGSVSLWDVASRRELWKIGGLPLRSAYHLRFSPDGNILATAGSSATIRLWNVATGQELQPHEGHSGGVFKTAFSHGGRLLVTLGSDGILCLWDSVTGQLKQTVPQSAGNVVFAPDDRTVVVGDSRGAVRFVETASGNEWRTLPIPGDAAKEEFHRLEDLAFTVNGKELTAIVHSSQRTAEENTLSLRWNVDTGEPILRRQEKTERCPWILSPDGQLRASYNHGAISNVREVKTGRLLCSLDGKCEGVFPVVFSRDGRAVAGVCHHGIERPVTIAIWELATGTEIYRFTPPLKGVRVSLAFSPDGSVLAAGGEEEAGLQLWDLTTGNVLARYQGYGASAVSLQFSDDGRRLAGGLLNGTAVVWDIEPALRRKQARGTNLTAKELEQLWTDLGKEDASVGHRALWALAGRPEQAISFLKSRLQPAADVDPIRIYQHLADLDSDRYAVREAAAKELEQRKIQAEAILRQVLAGKPSAEVRRRVEAILAGPRQTCSPDTLQRLRAIRALEYVGSAEARGLLERLARGSAAAWETEEAKASLERSTRRTFPTMP